MTSSDYLLNPRRNSISSQKKKKKRQKTLLNIHTGDAGAGDDLAFSLEEIL